jgi:hypothetical protein
MRMMHNQRPETMTRALMALMVASAVAGVAACGPVTSGPSGPAATGAGGATATPAAAGESPAPAASGSVPASAAPLCANISHLDTLVVSLSVPGRGHLPAALPAGITYIHDPARVQAVAAALCALPAMTPGFGTCPVGLGGSYRLVFAAGRQDYPPVVIRTSGCRTVSGLGPARATSAALWNVLARELGTRHPMGGTPAVP